MTKQIRIGTRDSELALWQAKKVASQLESLGYDCILVPVKSTGDIVLDKPLYELGITGIFTKTLDLAMLNGEVDIAVHSMKDVPTALPKGIRQTAVLERANVKDILVYNNEHYADAKATIATGSLRRKAQWLNKYPKHQVVDLRGNVNSRLAKLEKNQWDGAIFAKAGLDRIDVLPRNHVELDWMIPAPAQGAMLVVTMENDSYATTAVSKLNHVPTEICTTIERAFLRTLEGGCTAPIGAIATIENEMLHFEGALFSLDGTVCKNIKETIPLADSEDFGVICAKKLLANGGASLMNEIKKELNN